MENFSIVKVGSGHNPIRGDKSGLTPSHPGELRHIHKLRFWPLEDVLHDKYLLSREESRMIASFLNAMLHLHPEQRASALTMLKHPLISTLNVQGEIDQIVRAEEDARNVAVASEVTSPTEGSGENAGTNAVVEGEKGDAVAASENANQAGAGASSGTSTSAAKKKKKKQKQRNAALANADAEAIEQAEATIAQRAVDDANAMKPIDDAEDGSPSAGATAPASRSEVDVAGRERTSSSQRPGSS